MPQLTSNRVNQIAGPFVVFAVCMLIGKLIIVPITVPASTDQTSVLRWCWITAACIALIVSAIGVNLAKGSVIDRIFYFLRLIIFLSIAVFFIAE